jgi:uncharacterized protein YcfJ
MKRLAVALLAVGLATGSTAAFAQSSGYYPSADRAGAYAQGDAYYDYARVVRVDPVLDGRYGRTSAYQGQRCYETTTPGGYARDGGYRNDGSYRNDGYRDDGYGYGGQAGTNTGRNLATIVGGIAGAVLGSQVGGGTGTYAATAIGSMVGGMAGRQVYERVQRDRYTPAGTVRVCDPEPADGGYRGYAAGGAGAYDVTYEYNGRRYTRRMDYNPGSRVRVRVDVAPE